MNNPLWVFSLQRYQQPGVAQACLEAQDRCGADVNLLLYAAWLASHGQALSPAQWPQLQRPRSGPSTKPAALSRRNGWCVPCRPPPRYTSRWDPPPKYRARPTRPGFHKRSRASPRPFYPERAAFLFRITRTQTVLLVQKWLPGVRFRPCASSRRMARRARPVLGMAGRVGDRMRSCWGSRRRLTLCQMTLGVPFMACLLYYLPVMKRSSLWLRRRRSASRAFLRGRVSSFRAPHPFPLIFLRRSAAHSSFRGRSSFQTYPFPPHSYTSMLARRRPLVAACFLPPPRHTSCSP
jgi:hypothetical protein